MQNWLIEEELIEWLDTSGNISKRGREIRLITPEGRIVGRRLAVSTNYFIEYYALFQGTRGYSWWQPALEPRVFVAELPLEVLRFWTGRSPMTYYSEYFEPYRNPFPRGRWRLLSRSRCSQRLVERYEYIPENSYFDSSVVEWHIGFDSTPALLGAQVPTCSQLWWNKKLVRRHTLLHCRRAPLQERAFFQVPRKVKQSRVETERLFGTPLAGFAPPLMVQD